MYEASRTSSIPTANTRWRVPRNRRRCLARKPAPVRTKTRSGSVNSSDLGGRPAAAFDRAVHVALPLDAGVLAGEEQPPARTREPRAQRWIVRRGEIRVPTARQRFLLPHDLTPRAELRAVGPEPFERTRQSLRPVFRHDRLRGVAGAAAGEEREDARRAALFLVAVPDRAERECRSEGARAPRHPPEALRELQQCFRCAAVFQVGDRVVLLSGQRRHERNAPERGGWHGKHGVVAANLRDGAAVLHTDPDVLAAV